MQIIDELLHIIQQIESALDIQLTGQDFADGRNEIVHIFLHESCHAAVSRIAPWIHDLEEHEHTALDEILARLLESTIGSQLNLPIHSNEEIVYELGLYPINITLEQYNYLQSVWNERYWPNRDISGMANYCQNYLREEEITKADT